MNAANEAAVALFLNNKIRYLDIIKYVERAVLAHQTQEPNIDNILAADTWAREYTNALVN